MKYYLFDAADISTVETAYYATILPSVITAGGKEAIFRISDPIDGSENLCIHVFDTTTDPALALASNVFDTRDEYWALVDKLILVRFKDGLLFDEFNTLFPYITMFSEPFANGYTLVSMTETAYNLNRIDILTRGGVKF